MKEIILKRIKHLGIQLIIFGITYLISLRFKDIYFFGWLTHNKFAYIWVAIILFTMFGGSYYHVFIWLSFIIVVVLLVFINKLISKRIGRLKE